MNVKRSRRIGEPTDPVDGVGVLGPRLKAIRKAARRSIAEVSAATGISRSFLTLIESGKSDVTISRLLRLVDYYEVKIGDLVDTVTQEHTVIRRGTGHEIASPGEGMSLVVLLPDEKRRIRSLLVTLDPGGRMAEHARHEGEEYTYVLEGRAVLDLEGVGEITLERGDSVYYDAARGHAYRNVDTAPVQILSIVVPRRAVPEK